MFPLERRCIGLFRAVSKFLCRCRFLVGAGEKRNEKQKVEKERKEGKVVQMFRTQWCSGAIKIIPGLSSGIGSSIFERGRGNTGVFLFAELIKARFELTEFRSRREV